VTFISSNIKSRYFLAEKRFSKIQLFEQRATPGGVWNYTPLAREQGFTVPRTQPSYLPDQVIRPKDNGSTVEFMSPIYDLLETNIPHSLMCYSDTEFPQGSSLFPRHSAVLQYLTDYAKDLTPYISYQSQVLNVEKHSSQPNAPWEVQVLNLKTNETTKTEFDAVVVASGHYNDPFIPNIDGLVEFDKAHPGAVSHSKFYRRPNDYKDKVCLRHEMNPPNPPPGLWLTHLIESHCRGQLGLRNRCERSAVSSRKTPSVGLRKREAPSCPASVSHTLGRSRSRDR
jgi:cation diffusion facilitator CzcD-associated flavoprotein CzcO